MSTHRRASRPSLRRILAAAIALATLPVTSMPVLAGGGCVADLDGNGIVGGGDLAPLLGAWGGRGPADLNGDGVVGGADLSILLASWGPCPPAPCDTFVDLSYSSTAVSLGVIGMPGAIATIDGSATVGPFGQDGLLTVTLPNGESVSVELSLGMQKVMVSGTTVDIAPFGPAGIVLVNGLPTPIPVLLDGLMADIASAMPMASWAPTSKASLAIVALSETPEWQCNVQAALALEGGAADSQGQSGWCKFWAYSAATAIAGLAAAGCAALTAGCAAGTVVTIGGVGVPCTVLIGLCAGGAFAGTAAAYEAVLALWGD